MKYMLESFVVTLLLWHGVNSTGDSKQKKVVKRKSGYSRAYQRYLRRYNEYKRMYYQQYNPDKVKGRCRYSPNWKVDGVNPVYEHAREGNVVILYLLNTRCKVCIHELKSLHIWAEYFKKIDKKVVIVALNNREEPLPRHVRDQFPLIKIYQEPRQQNIFRQLRGKPGDVLVYDKCGRHLYYFGYPYSSLVQPFVRLAVKNTEYHYETMCGVCRARSAPTTTPTPPISKGKGMHSTLLYKKGGKPTATIRRVLQQVAKAAKLHSARMFNESSKHPTSGPKVQMVPTTVSTTTPTKVSNKRTSTNTPTTIQETTSFDTTSDIPNTTSESPDTTTEILDTTTESPDTISERLHITSVTPDTISTILPITNTIDRTITTPNPRLRTTLSLTEYTSKAKEESTTTPRTSTEESPLIIWEIDGPYD